MRKILLVEDDLFVRDLYIRYLEKANYQVTSAIDGEEGVEKAKAADFDMILLDIMLPKKTGIEVLKELRDQNHPAKDIPVFLLTNLGQEKIIDEAFKMGCQGYLLKAKLLPAEVVSAVSKFLDTRN